MAEGPSLRIDDVGGTQSWLVVRADAHSPAAQGLGAPFGRVAVHDGVTVLGVRPTEWIIRGSDPDKVEAFVGKLDRSGHVSVVDLSHGRLQFEIAGEHGPEVLASICDLDLSSTMTPNQSVTSATVAKVVCDLARLDGPSGLPCYLLAADRSYHRYLWAVLNDAATPLGVSLPGAVDLHHTKHARNTP